MSAYELLTSLSDLGVRLWVEGEGLRYSAPKGALTPDLMARLRDQKGELLEFLRKAGTAPAAPAVASIPRAARGGPLPLSYAQQRLWFLSQLRDGGAAYNIPLVWRMSGPLDEGALGRALTEIVRRHESLRTAFSTVDGAAAQEVREASPFPLAVVDLGPLPDAEREAAARRLVGEALALPFDLGGGLLLRASVLRLGPDDHLFAGAAHHIACDGWSVGVFLRELAALYSAFAAGRPSPLPELPVQYADFAAWQRGWLEGGVLEEQLGYWRRQLEGAPPSLEIPTDRARPDAQTFRGGVVEFPLDAADVDRLRDLCRRSGATLFAGLLAVFDVVLGRYAGTDDVVVGSPVANRTRAELEPLMGFFANTLVLRTDLSGAPTFGELLDRARRVSMEAHARQDVPFERLVEEISPDRDAARNPLVQVLLVLQNAFAPTLDMAGLRVGRWELEIQAVRLDLELHVWEAPDRLFATLMYNADLFDHTTIERMARHVRDVLAAGAADPHIRVADIALSDDPHLAPAPRALETLGAALAVERGDVVAVIREGKREPAAARPLRRALPAATFVDVDAATVSDGGLGAALARVGAGVVLASHALLRRLALEGEGRLPGCVRLVVADGGPPGAGLARAVAAHGDVRFVTAYAPAEAAGVFVSEPGPGRDSGPRPNLGIAYGLAVEVRDRAGRPLPTGLFGALWIGSDKESVVDSGLVARRTAEGAVELADTPASAAWIDGAPVDLGGVEAALLDVPGAAACVARVREVAGAAVVAAYVAPSGTAHGGRLEAGLRQRATGLPWPVRIVLLHTIPRTADGRVDERELSAVDAADDELAAEWETRLTSLPGVARAAVVVRDELSRPAPLHVSRLVRSTSARPPGGARGAAAAAAQVEARGARVAVSDGGPLEIAADAPRTLTEAFLRTAAARPERGVVYVAADGSETFESYAALLARARAVLAGLRARGLGPGDRAVLQAATHADHFAAFWGCVLAGVAPVTVAVAPSYAEKNAVVNKLFNAWELLGRPPVLASGALVDSVSGLARLLPMGELEVLAIDELLAATSEADVYEARPEDVLFLQLTSGSTGVPKCIQVTHRGVVHHAHGSRVHCGYGDDEVTLNWLPMDHVVPVLTCLLKDVYFGYTHVAVATAAVLADPLVWLDLLEKHRATLTWAPNFGFKLVADALAKRAGRSRDLSSVVYFMNAGEQVTLPVVREFLRLVAPFGVPERAMQPAFGMAEACTCMTYLTDFSCATGVRRFRKASLSGVLEPAGDDEKDVSEFVDLGGPVPGVAVRIADAANRPVPEGVIGRMQIKGAVVTPGYLNNDEANREAFVGDGWFNSGDLGFLLDGRLTLTGREKEIIIVNGANFYCYEIEDVVNGVEGVEPTFSAACGFDDAATGSEGLAVFYVPRGQGAEPDVRLVRAVREAVTRNLGISPGVVVPLARDEFPKTTSGKIQRTSLKKRLTAGDFRDLLESIDVRLENENTVPAWFYRRVWRRAEPSSSARRADERATVVVTDSAGIGEALCARLVGGAGPVVRVEPGGAFERLGPVHFRIDPGDAADVGRLFGVLAADGVHVGDVVHLVDAAPLGASTTDDEAPAARVLALARALGRLEDGSRRRLTVAAAGAQSVDAGDPVSPSRAAVVGLLETVAQETPGLECVHVDLQTGDANDLAAHVHDELRYREAESQVAYRAGRRLRARLERVAFEGEPGEPPIVHAGLYLVTGGLGGVGLVVARMLIERYGARLLLVGRRDLPPRDAWDGGAAFPSAAAVELLERAGEVEYRALDVADAGALAGAVEAAEARWGRRLDGVFHAAGVSRERMVEGETAGGLAAARRPKLGGALAIARVLGGRPDALFVGFSSVNALFGGVGAGAYSAANAALEGFAADRERTHPGRSFCFAWTLWDDTGMSRGYAMKGLSRGKGFLEIEPARGVRSLLAGLARGEPRLLVGLDGASPNVRRRTDERPVAARALAAFVVPEPGASPRLGAVAVPDPVGGPGAVDVITVAGLPTTAEGGIDRDALAGSAGRARAAVLPRTELESRIAAVFKRALGVGRVGVGESFFELGGHSLLAVRLVTELRSAVGIDVPLDRIVESPTVAGLARWVEEQTESGAEPAAPLPACIVPVQPRGTRRPFFCVHPASGSPACFAALASYLGEDRPFYGFLSPGLLDDRPVLRRVEELAELYAGAMREVQPDGPYLLGGWSSGGPVAYEMARILERDGQRVALLALIDSGLMQSDAAEYGGGSRGPLALLRGTATLVSFARQLGVPRRYADVRAILQLGGISLPPTPRDAFRGGPRAGLRLARRLNGELVRATRAFRANTYAGLEYQPKPFGGTVTALRTRREGRDPALEDLRAFAARVDHVEVPGNHMTVVLGTDDTRALAERLGACIDAASTNS